MGSHLVYCLGLLAVCWGPGAVSAAGKQAPPLAAYFNGETADALVRRIETVATGMAAGLVVSQQHRWLPELRFLLIDATLSNDGEATATIENVPIVNWTFRLADSQDAARYRKLTYRRDVWYDSTYWTGPDWTRVGKNWHHPGTNTPSVRRFTVPRDGRVRVTGRVYKFHADGNTDGVRLSIRHRGNTVWKAEIDGADTRGVEPDLALDVRVGEAIRFVVHKRGSITCDTTHWDPVITYANGRTFQASKGFSTKEQGDDGWFYEMEADPKNETGLPRVCSFDRDFVLRQQTPGLRRPVKLTDRDALPLLVIGDGEDRTGIALVVGGSDPWQFHSVLTSDGRLDVKLTGGREKPAVTLNPGESLRLPRVILGAYKGSWIHGMTLLQQLLDSGIRDPGIEELRQRLAAAENHELDFRAMVQDAWHREDKLDGTAEAYAAATARHLEKTRRLLDDLRTGQPEGFLAAEAEQLEKLAAGSVDIVQSRERLYHKVRRLKRRIALSNPLMGFGRLLFVKRVPTSYSHLVMQYFGWRARPGGGIFVLEQPGRSLACHDILDGKLADGNVLEPRLSYDGKRIVFSFVGAQQQYDPGQLVNDTDDGFYHIFEVNTDGTGLRQLTHGPYDDVMPTYLPDGGIAFCSTRRRGYARCFGGQFSRRWHVYTLHRMDGDGRNLHTLSFHDTNEWFPAVSNTGHLLYARWDYIDRDAVTHQNLWATRPDGTNPVAVWGNATARPHCTFQIRPIPDSSKIVFTASAHHSVAGGSIAMVDPAVGDNGQQPITRVTPEIPFPEAEGRDIKEYYAAPWPLSEKYFLVAYSPTPLVWEPGANGRSALGIYLLDVFGNRELIYRDPAIGSTNPCPLSPRPTPPELPGPPAPDAPATGEMVLADVNEGLGDIPPGTIKRLRIIQIFPKTTHVANSPPIGLAREENARAVLGTVPVEPDGSAYFVVPARTPILFQALDENGMAYQTMRSTTYLQPGERVTCIGCHENRMTAPPGGQPMALRRRPSQIDPGSFGGRPFSYVRVVQPVLEKHCVNCHGGDKLEGDVDLTGVPHQGYTKSYCSLCGDRDFWHTGTNPKNAAEALVPRFGGRNQIQVTPPGGMYGARGSRLLKILRQGHEDVNLSGDELRRLALWIDCNAIFYGTYSPEDQARQLRGEVLPMPEVQ